MVSFDSILSWELLFWIPTTIDLLLLVFTFSSCQLYGVDWYLKAIQPPQTAADTKKNDDGGDALLAMSELSPAAQNTVDAVWELAMIAYSGYAVLLPLASYWAARDPALRVSFCWGMTVLMVCKATMLLRQPEQNLKQKKQKLWSLFAFNFPTYGGYAILKTFVL